MQKPIATSFLAIAALMLAALACGARAAGQGQPAETAASSPTAPSLPADNMGDVETDVTYCTPNGVELKMDIYYPTSGTGPWPVAMYVHGGGWVSGDKSEGAKGEIAALTQVGFLVTTINYRLAPDHKFPAQIEDVKCAVRFLRAHAADYNLDPTRIGAWGGSAGGHLVSLLGTSDKSAGWDVGEYLDQSSRVQAVVDMFGPSDLTAEDFITMRRERKAEILFGINDLNAPVVAQASPINHISSDDPPFLIIQGTEDDIVPASQSQNFYQALLATGVPAQLVLVENAGHGLIPTAQDTPPSPSRSEVTAMIVRFFEETLMGEPGGAALPPWLEAKTSEVSETSEVLRAVEEFITLCVTAARQKRPEAAQLFDATGQMAVDSSLPEEIRALANVLHRILAGDFDPDLSALPEELAALVRRALMQ